MTSGRGRRLPVAAFIPLVALATYETIGALLLVPDRGDDFQRLYVSAERWASGQNPFAIVIADTPNLNHPLWLPLFRLFTLGSEPAGFVAWSVMSLVLLGACLPAIADRSRVAALDLAVLLLASSGTFLALVFGQVSFVLMALFTTAWCVDRAGNPRAAGALLGILTVLKPFYGLFGVFLLWRREWQAFAWYGASFLVGTFVGWLFVGTETFLEWIFRLRDVQWRWHIYNASAWGVGDRLFTVQPFFRATSWTPLVESPILARVLTMVLLLAIFAVLWRTVSKSDVDRSYAILGLGSLLISPLGWLYYLPAFAGPVVATLSRQPSRWLWPALAIAVCPSLLLVSREYGRLGTVFVGQWSFTIVGSLFLLTAGSAQKQELES